MTEAQATEIIRLLRVITVLTVQTPLCLEGLRQGAITSEELFSSLLQVSIKGIDGKLM